MKRVLFLPWSIELPDGETPLDARQGAYGRQLPRYLSLRLEEVPELQPNFAPYCTESEEGTVFVVSGLQQTAEELREIGKQYGVEYVVGGHALFAGHAEICLQLVHVTSGWYAERLISGDLSDCRAFAEGLLSILIEELEPEAVLPDETECATLSPHWTAVSPFFCAIDRLMALEIGNEEDDAAAVFDLYFEALAADPDWIDGVEQLIGTALDYGLDGIGPLEIGVEALERLLLLRGDLHKAWEALGYLYEQQGRIVEAVTCLEQAYHLDSVKFASHHRLGTFYRRLGRFAEAEKMIRLSLDRESEALPLINELGVVLGELNRHQEAIPLFRRAVELSPISGAFYANLGVALCRTGARDEAEQVFQQGLCALDPHGNVFFNYAQLLAEQERHVEWVHVLFQGIRMFPDGEERTEMAAQLVEGVRNWLILKELPPEVAAKGQTWVIGLIESLVELIPACKSGWVVLSELYRQDGRSQRALDCLLRVEAEEDDNAWLQIHIGALLAGLERYAEAELRFERVLAVEEYHQTALSNLIVIMAMQDRYDRALHYLERYREVARTDPEWGEWTEWNDLMQKVSEFEADAES